MVGTRSRPFVPRKEAFLRLRADVITIHKDEEDCQLVMPPFSMDNMRLARRKDGIFKMYFRIDGSDTVVRLRMEESIASAFSFLLHESWRHKRGGGWSEGPAEEWEALVRGWTRRGGDGNWKRKEEEEWRETSIMITSQYLFFLYQDGCTEEKLDLRKVISCRSVFDQRECCEQCCEEKKEEERQCIYSIALKMTHPQVVWMDSGEIKAVSTLRSIINQSIAIPQTSLLTCRLSANDVPLVIEEAIQFLSAEKRISTRGIYRISAKNGMKNKLVDQMIHAPSTAFSSLDVFRSASNGMAMNGEYARDEVYMVCDGLRSFLRRMESPLIPEVLHIPLFDAMGAWSASCRLEKVQSVLHSRRFPSIHINTLALILAHLREVAKRSDHNGMTTDNLATILAPCLFSSESSWEAVADITPRVSSTLFLIDNYHLLSFSFCDIHPVV